MGQSREFCPADFRLGAAYGTQRALDFKGDFKGDYGDSGLTGQPVLSPDL